MTSDNLFTRDEVLSGMPARRARTALFLIESRTAHLVARSQRAMDWQSNQRTTQDQDLAFLEAFAESKDPPLRPSIQDLERHVAEWAEFIPENPAVKASLAYFLGEKYHFTRGAIPRIRQALELDDPGVQRAFQRQYQKALEAIYTARPSPLERLRWAWARLSSGLESLPPFWTAYALTLTETIGVGILALPIAVAGIGPLGGVLLLILIGAVNLVTIAAMAEAVSRNGNIRYGQAYFGRLVSDFLGKEGSLILTVALFLINFLGLMAYYIGLSTTLEDATRIPALVWIGALFAFNLYFLSRRSINATVAVALLVGLVNIAVILALALLALPHIRPDYLTYLNLPFLNGQPFDPNLLQLVFGVILVAFFGHTAMGNCAKIVLKRDPSARSLMHGSLAAQLSALILYILWVLAVNGTIAPEELATEMGTALIPLARQVGPMVYVFGSIFIVLAMGMGSIHFSLGFYNMIQEWLPIKRKPVLLLLRRRGQIILKNSLAGDKALQLGVIYLGLENGQPRFRFQMSAGQDTWLTEVTMRERMSGKTLFKEMGQERQTEPTLEIQVYDPQPDNIRLQIITSLEISSEGEWQAEEATLPGLLDLPEEQRRLFNWILRKREASLAEIMQFSGKDQRQVKIILDALTGVGYVYVVETPDGQRYRPHLATKKSRQVPQDIWDKLDIQSIGETLQPPSAWKERLDRIQNALLSRHGQLILGSSPLVVISVISAWLVLTDSESFSRTLSFLGLIVVSLLGGAFPVLLLIASRRKGEYVPGVVYHTLGNPLITGGIFLLSLAGLFIHGLVIWQNPLERGVALATGLILLGATGIMIRRGGFFSRIVIELRKDFQEDRLATLAITAAGKPAPTQVELIYQEGEISLHTACSVVDVFDKLRSANLHIPEGKYHDIKVWIHQINSVGDSQSLPAQVEYSTEDILRKSDPGLSQGQIVIPLTDFSSGDQRLLKLILESQS